MNTSSVNYMIGASPDDPEKYRLWYRYLGLSLNADWPRNTWDRAEMRAVRLRLARKFRAAVAS